MKILPMHRYKLTKEGFKLVMVSPKRVMLLLMLVFSLLFYVGVSNYTTLFPEKEQVATYQPKKVEPSTFLTTPKQCLAMTVYHEARNQPDKGQLAVAMVVLNRAKEKMQSVCNVAFEPYQFSWANSFVNYAKQRQGFFIPAQFVPKNHEAWDKAVHVASTAFTMRDFTKGATFYHTKAVKPRWRKKFKKVGIIGDHIFYARA